jgi:preprotein translocase subunit SecG
MTTLFVLLLVLAVAFLTVVLMKRYGDQPTKRRTKKKPL